MSDVTHAGPSLASGRFATEPHPAADRSAGTPHVGMTSRQAWVTIALAVLILIPSMYGFVGKFVEFVNIYRGASGGEFAVAPIMNYLLASAGFFCMLLWAAWNGMFRDVERPKIDFLENERLLDRDART